MAWLNVTTNDGELVERISLSGYDFDKLLAQAALMQEILPAVKLARTKEREAPLKKLLADSKKRTRRK